MHQISINLLHVLLCIKNVCSPALGAKHPIIIWIFYLLAQLVLRHNMLSFILHLTQGNIDINLSIQLYILNIFLKSNDFQKFFFLCVAYGYSIPFVLPCYSPYLKIWAQRRTYYCSPANKLLYRYNLVHYMYSKWFKYHWVTLDVIKNR